MKKKYIAALMAAAFLPAIPSSAALLDDVKIISSDSGETQISGDIGGTQNNRFVSLFIVNDSAMPTDENAEILYIGGEEISYDGKYTHSFKYSFNDVSKVKLVAVTNETTETKIINYAKSSWVEENIYDAIKNGTLKGDELVAKILEYREVLGLDLPDLTSQRDKNILAKRIESAKDTFKSNKEQIIANVKAEIELLNGIRSAQNWTVGEKLIQDTLILTGISLTEYNKLADKSTVMGKIIGNEYSDYEALNTALQAEVSNAAKSEDSGSIGGGGGGGSSSSGSSRDWISENIPTNTPVQKYGFNDLDGYSWAQEAINALYSKQIVDGVDSNTFAPAQHITREALVKLAVAAFGFDTSNVSSNFADVPSNRWSYPYISCASKLGIISGVTDETFCPDAEITREDMVLILKKCMEVNGAEFNELLTDFSDWNEISDYAKDAVGAFAYKGYISGVGDGKFAPKAPATRAEAAKIIYELIR